MAKKTSLQIIASTDRGMEREHNEDYHGYIPDLSIQEFIFFDSKRVDSLSSLGSVLILADGMGGTNAGEVASKHAVDSIKDFMFKKAISLKSVTEPQAKEILFEAIKDAQKNIVHQQKVDSETKGMGTTLVLNWIIKNKVYIAWAGDSRSYVYNKVGGLRQLSSDHSLVQELVDTGKITEEQAFYHPQSNIITQSLGDSKRPPISGFVSYNLQPNDTLLLCSDGLNGMVLNSKIENILETNSEQVACAKALIDEANKEGGHDNITVILAFAESVDSPLSPSILKKTPINVTGNTNNSPKNKKLWIGILIGIIISLVALFVIQTINKNTGKDTIPKVDSMQIDEKINKGFDEVINDSVIEKSIKENPAEPEIEKIKQKEKSKTPDKPKVKNETTQPPKKEEKVNSSKLTVLPNAKSSSDTAK